MNTEELVQWALKLGLSTGHASTTESLLEAVGEQITEMRDKVEQLTQERDVLKAQGELDEEVIRYARARLKRYREALEKLSKLGNGDRPGNSAGNRIAQQALQRDEGEAPDINVCPNCDGPADNGFDRCVPTNPYFCTKCEPDNEH